MDERERRLQTLREQIERGEYRVDNDALAAVIVARALRAREGLRETAPARAPAIAVAA